MFHLLKFIYKDIMLKYISFMNCLTIDFTRDFRYGHLDNDIPKELYGFPYLNNLIIKINGG